MSSVFLFFPTRGEQAKSIRADAVSFRSCLLLNWGKYLGWGRGALGLALFLLSLTSFAFEGPLSFPAIPSDKAATSPLTAVAMAGDRLVAVGQRGHIVLSDDAGTTWKQASVPVSSDLVAVSFASAQHGWAVGHGGVVLKTDDGGLNWVLQLDGEKTSRLILEYYANHPDGGSVPDAQMFIEREQVLLEYGGTQALMDVYFENEQTGYVVGVFNRLLKTTDGGETWVPWSHRIDNPYELHFYSINHGQNGLYVVGEQGMVWRLDEESGQFVDIATSYGGTFFGSAIGADRVIVFGMRGSAYVSDDQGASWARLAIDSVAGITDGVLFDNGAIALVNLAGELLVSIDGGKSFTAQNLEERMPFYGVAQISSSQLALVGAEGVRELAVVGLNSSSGRSSTSLIDKNNIAMNRQELRYGAR